MVSKAASFQVLSNCASQFDRSHVRPLLLLLLLRQLMDRKSTRLHLMWRRKLLTLLFYMCTSIRHIYDIQDV